MERVQETLEQIRNRTVVGGNSNTAEIYTKVEETDDGIVVVAAVAEWWVHDEKMQAEATRTLDTTGHDELTIKQVIDASKRDALRELVTQLQLHEVL